MIEKIFQNCIELTNKQWSSALLKRVVQSPVSKHLISPYSKVYDINTDEVSKPIAEYHSLHEFFTRTLAEGHRPVAQGRVLTSPVDAKIESFGAIERDMIFTVKGKPYKIEHLLGSIERAKAYDRGQYIVFYLSPADYHRMHSPVDARVVRQYVLGHHSYPVNNLGLTYGKKPLSHNYRMVSQLETAEGMRMDFIKVGAMFVNSIALTNTSDTWYRGEEVGYFTFGSTVVMLFEQETVQFNENVTQGAMIQMGTSFANVL